MTSISRTLKSARSTPDLKKTERAGRDYECKECQHKISESGFIVSKAFLGFQGRAVLVRQVSNVKFSAPTAQLMRTGGYMIEQISCQTCSSELGWKFIKAFERTEQWKENMCLLELDLLTEVNLGHDEVLAERSSVFERRPSISQPSLVSSASTSDAEESDAGPKTPTVLRYTRLEDGSVVPVGTLPSLQKKPSRKRMGLDLTMVKPVISPPSAVESVFELDNSDNEDEDEGSADAGEATPVAEDPPSPSIHRRVASMEPPASEEKHILPRRPSEPIVMANYLSPLRRTPSSLQPAAKPPPQATLPSLPDVSPAPSPPEVQEAPAEVKLNPHDSLANEIDQITRDLAPILQSLPKNSDMSPADIQRKLSGSDISPSPVAPITYPRKRSVSNASPSPIPSAAMVVSPIESPTEDIKPPSAATLRMRRPSIQSMANRPSFAELTKDMPPLPAGAVKHVREASLTGRAPSFLSESSSPQSRPSSSGPPSPPSSTRASTSAPSPMKSALKSSRSASPASVLPSAPAPIDTTVAPAATLISGSTRLERAKVAELMGILGLDGSSSQPPVTEEAVAESPASVFPSVTFEPVSATEPVPPPLPAPTPTPAPPPAVEPTLSVPGRTLPFPRAPSPDASQLAARSVRRRAMSDASRRPSLADLRALRQETEAAMPRPISRNTSTSNTTPASSRSPSMVDTSGNRVITTRLPALKKQTSMQNLLQQASSGSTSSLAIPRKGSVTFADSRPSSRVNSIVDDSQPPRVITTRLPAMNMAKRAPSVVAADVSRPSSRTDSFFETDPEPKEKTSRLPSLGRRPSLANLGTSAETVAAPAKSMSSRATKLFGKIRF